MSLFKSFHPCMIFLISASLTSLSVATGFSITQDFGSLSESKIQKLFEQWQKSYRKVYKHPEEAERRLMHFKSNLKYVVDKNSKRGGAGSSSHIVGLNKFADMSNEEFRHKYLSKVKKPANRSQLRREMRTSHEQETHKVSSCDAPSSLDWRKYGAVTGVKDQGDCGMLLKSNPVQYLLHQLANSTDSFFHFCLFYECGCHVVRELLVFFFHRSHGGDQQDCNW